MSYRVDYNPETKNRYPNFIKIRKRISIRPLLFAVAVIVICYSLYHYDLLGYLIPGDPAVTAAAFSGMMDDIGAGETVRQAVLNFCKEIIVNGS